MLNKGQNCLFVLGFKHDMLWDNLGSDFVLCKIKKQINQDKVAKRRRDESCRAIIGFDQSSIACI